MGECCGAIRLKGFSKDRKEVRKNLLLSFFAKSYKCKTYIIFLNQYLRRSGKMTETTKRALLEIGSTVAAFAVEVWRKVIKHEEKKEGK